MSRVTKARALAAKWPAPRWVWAVSLALVFGSSRARALSEIPGECGSQSQFETELQRRVGSDRPLRNAHVRLDPELSGYRLLVDVAGEERELHDQDCRELMRAAVVIAVSLLEPTREEPAAVYGEPPAAPAPPAPAHSRRSRPALGVAAGVGLELGLLPQPSGFVEIDAQLKWSNSGFALGARYLAPSSVRDESGHGARVGALATYAAGWFEPWPELQARVGVNLFRLHGTGLGSVQPLDDQAWELGPSAGLSFTPFARPPFWTSIGAEAQLNLLRPSFEIQRYGQVFRVPALSGSTFVRAGVVW